LSAISSAVKRKVNWVPPAVGLALLGLIVWRMVYLHGLNPNFNASFFAGAFLRSFQLGSLYALIALGYTMVYGIIRLINFAHGEVFMVGAFAAYFLFSTTPMAWPVAIVVALVVTYGFMQILNFWRGRLTDPLVLVGGALAFVAVSVALASTTLGWLAAMVASMFITGVLGVTIDRVASRPRRAAQLDAHHRHRRVVLPAELRHPGVLEPPDAVPAAELLDAAAAGAGGRRDAVHLVDDRAGAAGDGRPGGEPHAVRHPHAPRQGHARQIGRAHV